MTAALLKRPLLHWHLPAPLSRLPHHLACPRSGLSLNTSLVWQHRQYLHTSSFCALDWRRLRTQRFNFKVLCGVRLEGLEKSVRLRHSEAPQLVEELPEMVKKEKVAGPKQLTLRTTLAHANSTLSFVQILGTGMDTGDTAPCVLLFFDQRRFLFNAGEGLQRFCIEHKIKLSKIDHVFLTRVCTETAGGLPGLLLTLAGIGDSVGMAVNIWGPSDLHYLVDAMRTFVPNASVVHTHSFGAGPGALPSVGLGSNGQKETSASVLLEDDVVKISAVLLCPEPVEALENDKSGLGTSSTAATGSGVKKGQKRPRVEEPLPATGQVPGGIVADTCRAGEVAVVYVCELPEVKGKFDPIKAEAFFRRPGPHYGLLQAGKSVIADDGKTLVHPSDVMGPSSPGPIFVLVDCPTVLHIPSLISAPGLCSLQETSLVLGSLDAGSLAKQVTLMVHISPAVVTEDPRYQEWMLHFPRVQHVMAGHGVLNMAAPILKSSARVVSRLNFICPQVFPVSSLQPKDPDTELPPIETGATCSGTVAVAENLLKAWGFDRSAVPGPFSIKEVQEQLALDIPEVLEASRQIADLWNTSMGHVTISDSGVGPMVTEQEESHCQYYPVEEPWLAECLPKLGTGLLTHSNSGSTEEGRHEPNVRNEMRTSSSTGMEPVSEDHLEEDIPDCLQGVSREEMEMVFLGTGSSQPSKYRNVSAIYVHLFERGGLMLDCGEGTYAQLKRRYGSQGADEVLAGLKCVWISHIHADHHTGLARLLSVRRHLLESQGAFVPILVIGPKQLKRFLDAYGRLEDLGMEFLDCSQTTAHAEVIARQQGPSADGKKIEEENINESISGSSKAAGPKKGSEGFGDGNSARGGLIRIPSLTFAENELQVGGSVSSPRRGQMRNYWLQPGVNLLSGLDWGGREKLKETLSAMGLAKLISVPVVHCPHAFGVVIEAQGRIDASLDRERLGWKLVYSGDTRPCKALVEASEGATVLIHEATFDDGMPEEALAKNHSLTREAIETGIAAGVYRTILTHFSQRYPKIPVFDGSYTTQTCVAFDMMSANLADLPLLPSLLPALKLLFKEELMAVEEEGTDEPQEF